MAYVSIEERIRVASEQATRREVEQAEQTVKVGCAHCHGPMMIEVFDKIQPTGTLLRWGANPAIPICGQCLPLIIQDGELTTYAISLPLFSTNLLPP